MSGWSGPNQQARIDLIKRRDDDIYFLSEIHCKDEQKVIVEGYKSIQFNRVSVHCKGTKGSGGVCFLIKDKIFKDFRVHRVDHELEGIIALKLQNRFTNFTILLIGTYLPPESSVYGDDPDRVFQELVSLIYENTDSDLTYLLGDYNARIGNKRDLIESVDNIPERVALDLQTNDHGTSLINFLLQANCCVVNGRIDPLLDSFTSVSHRGKAVVDYIIAAHDSLNYISKFEVCNISELLLKFRLMEFCEGLLSDHSMLRATVNYTTLNTNTTHDQSQSHVNTRDNTGTRPNCSPNLPRRFRVTNIPDELMYSAKTVELCLDIIDKLLTYRLDQERLDTIYDKYVQVYYEEMGEFFTEICNTPYSKKSVRHTPKPYWSKELSMLWKAMYVAEKHFVKTDRKSQEYPERLAEFQAR